MVAGTESAGPFAPCGRGCTTGASQDPHNTRANRIEALPDAGFSVPGACEGPSNRG